MHDRRAGWRVCVLVLVAVFGAGAAGAEKIFTYRDDSGGLLFTDRAEQRGGELVGIEQVEPAGPKNRVDIRRLGADDDFRLEAFNEYHGPVEIRIELKEGTNVASSCAFPCSIVLKPRERRELFRMWLADRRLGGSYSYTTSIHLGDPQAAHADRTLYALPIAPADVGQAVISQGFNSTRTHGDVQSRYAIDIPAPEGTPVRAARAGTVMDVASDFFRAGSTDRFKDRANFVRIVHDDGTMALYAHLQLESVRVRPGERVAVGQVLAGAGNTGYSGGPHLHFAVQKNFGGELRSVPFFLMQADGSAVVPKEGLVFR